MTDDQIKARLREMCGAFEPADKWQHVIHQLKQGRTYFAYRYGPKEWQLQIGFTDTRKLRLGRDKNGFKLK